MFLDDFEPLSEEQRKELLEASDERPVMARIASYLGKKEELKETRTNRRTTVGCNCALSTEGKSKEKYAFNFICRCDLFFNNLYVHIKWVYL